jgi:hypothetical protein
MNSKEYKPLYVYLKDGIYINYGPIKGTNLTKSYSEEPDKVLDYLENILDYEFTPYKTKVITKEVIEDLTKINEQ